MSSLLILFLMFTVFIVVVTCIAIKTKWLKKERKWDEVDYHLFEVKPDIPKWERRLFEWDYITNLTFVSCFAVWFLTGLILVINYIIKG